MGVNTILLQAMELTTEEQAIKEAVQNPTIIKKFIEENAPVVFGFCIRLVIAILIYFIGSKIIKTIIKIFKHSMERSNVEPGAISFLSSFIKYILNFLLILFLLSGLGVSAVGTTVVALLGSAGVTAGLALQGSLSNFVGGVLILILKPFVVGDYIMAHAEGQEGTVAEMSIFYTKLKTIDNKLILLPNGTLANSTITNVSKMDKRRVDIIVGVSYEANLSKAKFVLGQVVEKQEKVLKDSPIDIFVSELADSSVNLGVRVWVNSEDYWPVKWKMTEDIKNALDENRISIPYPQVDVHMIK